MNQSVTFDMSLVMEAARASGLAVSLCTITTPPASTTFGDSGAPDPTTEWAELAGHVDIACMNAPINTGDRVSPAEQRTMEQILGRQLRHVWLTDYYPAITNVMRATVDGVVYDIVETESDSQSQMTRMALELVTI